MRNERLIDFRWRVVDFGVNLAYVVGFQRGRERKNQREGSWSCNNANGARGRGVCLLSSSRALRVDTRPTSFAPILPSLPLRTPATQAFILRAFNNCTVLPAFNYCSDVWHFCSKRSKDKLEQLNKQALTTALNSNLDCETLLRIIGSVNLQSPRVQNMLVTKYKTLHGIAPPYLRLLLDERKMAYNLRGTLKLNLPRVPTISYGLQSFRYAAPQERNTLRD